MIMRYGQLAAIMSQQQDKEAHKLMEKEQRAMTSTPTGKALLLVWCVLSLQLFPQSSIPQNLGVASKVTTLAVDSFSSSRIVYSIYKRYLQSPKKYHCGSRVSLNKLAMARDDMHEWIDELHRNNHQKSDCDRNIFWPPYL